MSCEPIKMDDGTTVLANVRRGMTLSEEDKKAIAEWVEFCRERRWKEQQKQNRTGNAKTKLRVDHERELETDPPRGLRTSPLPSGWHCPNCGRAHAPDIATCPEPPKGGSLQERLKSASL